VQIKYNKMINKEKKDRPAVAAGATGAVASTRARHLLNFNLSEVDLESN
jgi:hypothetical protein